jgi:emfourin
MQVSFRVSGGVHGLVQGVELDTESLDATLASRLEALIAESGLRGRHEAFLKAARDMPQYEVIITDRGKVISLDCDDRSVPAKARPLIRFLTERSEPITP